MPVPKLLFLLAVVSAVPAAAQSTAPPSSSPHPALAISSPVCEQQAQAIRQLVLGPRFTRLYDVEAVSLPGFQFASYGGGCDRDTMFTAARYTADPANITFAFATDAPDQAYAVCMDAQTGAFTVRATAAAAGSGLVYPASLVATDVSTGATVVVAAWEMRFLARQDFALSASGIEEVARIQQELAAAGIDAAAENRHDINATVLIPVHWLYEHRFGPPLARSAPACRPPPAA